MQQHKKINKNIVTTSVSVDQPNIMAHMSGKRTIATLRRFCLVAFQVLVLACALPPPLQTLQPALLPTRWSFAVQALPITSKPIESTAENLAWQAWLMLPPEQRQLEKSRKVTPKSIFSLPFRDCPPGHQLFQSRCIPTVNINQSDLLTQQVLGLFVGTETGGEGDNAYELDYEDEEYGLGFGEGEPVVMYESPQSFSGNSAAGPSNAQQPPVRDEPLKFNLFEQKYPTSDYEADISGSAMEGSGGARPLNDMLASNMSADDRVEVTAIDNDAGAIFFNSSQLLDTLQGFLQRHATTSGGSDANATMANATSANNKHIFGSENSTNRQASSDLHTSNSNKSSFAVGDIDAIILPAVSSAVLATTAASGDGASGGNHEPHRISLFKDDSSVHLISTVTEKYESDMRAGSVDTITNVDDDLVAAAQQQQNVIAQFLRADALLPLSRVTSYDTTTEKSTVRQYDDRRVRVTPPSIGKDEHPRSVSLRNSAAAAEAVNTDAQETSFTTSTESEGTTSFQIDETTVVEANEDTGTEPESTTLLEAISKQQHLEFEKSKVEPVDDAVRITTSSDTTINQVQTTTAGDDTTSSTQTIADQMDETTTVEQAIEVKDKLVELAMPTETTTQSSPSAAAFSATVVSTTTAEPTLSTTPNADRFHSAPAAVVAPIRMTSLPNIADKQVSAVVTTAISPVPDTIASVGTTASSTDVVSDVPRSGNNDLVNVAASGINSDTNTDNNNKKTNKKSLISSAVANTATAAATSEINIEQELRMINELVKGKRQLNAMKMAAIKRAATKSASAATETTTLHAAIEPKLVVKKSTSTAQIEKNASGAKSVEVGRDDTESATTQVSAIADKATEVIKLPLAVSRGSAYEVLQTTTTAGDTKVGTQPQTLAKMESSSQPPEAITVDNSKITETSSTSVEPAITTNAEPTFGIEDQAGGAEATGATFWSRIMPIFGFGEAAEAAESTTIATTTTALPVTQEIAGGALIGSISSNSSVNNIRNSSSSINDISSISKNNSNDNIIISNNNSHIRKNSKIIQIDQLSDNSLTTATVTAATTTTNTLRKAAATVTSATTTTTMSETIAQTEKSSFAPRKEPADESTYWWLPAGWRTQREKNEDQPLLFRLWSAFPESQMKGKVRT